MYQVYLGLGSNLGNRLDNLAHAIEAIGAISSIKEISSIYETEAVDMEEANPFLNVVVAIDTSHDPPLLMAQLKKIEKKLGRRSRTHNEPRIIDIDILLYRGFAYEDHTITVPHPKMEHRRFVLEPFCEIAPTAVHPMIEKTIATLLRNCHDRHKVKRTEYQINYSIINSRT